MASKPIDLPPAFHADAGLSVLDNLSSGVFVFDHALRIQFMNQSAEVLTHFSRHRVMGLTLGDLFDSGDGIHAFCERALNFKHSMDMREISITPLADPENRLEVDVTATPKDDGGLVLEMRDIANRLRMKRDSEMVSRNSVSRTIIRQLAHEIKNPLGGLRGAAQLLSRRLPSPDLVEYTDVIIHEADRLVALVDAMLGPNRPTHRNEKNLHRVLDHVAKLVEAGSPEGVSIVRDFDPSLPKILIDQDQLTQAVLNLVRNALQAVGESGTITLRSRIETGFTIGEIRYSMVARIDVQDTGPGVPPELRDQIFFPLVTGRPNGVGLGLALSLDLVNRHDGLIKLHSGLPTRFSIYLPLKPKEIKV